MDIELSEILTCPDCRSPQGLIVMVEELDGKGRVMEGDLGCSRCQRRYPVRRGVIDLLEGMDGHAEGGGDAGDLPSPEGLAVELGGLLDLADARGAVVLGHGLLPAASRLAGMAGEIRLLALAGDGEATGGEGFTLARVPAGRLPLLPGKSRGVGLWRPDSEAVAVAARALAPGGRLAVLRPGEPVRRELGSSGLEVLASEERAAVARRPG